jgi:hypothetical protein
MTTTDESGNWWHGVTSGLLLGFVGMAALLHQTFLQGGGFVPTGASQLMMWVAVLGIVAYATLRRDLAVGYWLSLLTGGVYLAFVGVLFAGVLGPLPEGGPLVGFVLGPVAQSAYAVVLILSAAVALRRAGGRREVATAREEASPGAQ